MTEDLLTFSTLTKAKMLHHLLWECAHFSHLRTACQCAPALSSLGLDGATAPKPVIEVSTESATPKPSCGKKGGELRAVRRWGPGPPLVEVLWCTDEYRLQRLQAAAADRWFWPVPRPHGLSGARSLRKGHNKVLICRSQLLKEFDFSTTTI